MSLTAALLATAIQAPATSGAVLPDSAPAHLAIVLRLDDAQGLARLLAELQDSRSAHYHGWLTPQQFGDRFGAPPSLYRRFEAWLRAQGFAVTPSPNRLFLEATGTVGGVRRLLGVQLRIEGDGDADEGARSFEGTPRLPPDLAPHVLHLAGLDTRHRYHQRLAIGGGTNALGADDLRTFYDLRAFTRDGGAAAGLITAVLGTQESSGLPPVGPITDYFQNVSHATATYTPDLLPNPNGDYDHQGNSEYQLDVEMQSVGAANAAAIHLVLPPASEVFTTGVNYVVNTLSTAVAVSSSLGLCEPEESRSEIAAMQLLVQQGLAEGQSWFAAAGDTGADDCFNATSGTGNGFKGGNATVDFPCSMPEFVCLGGAEIQGAPNWDASGNLDAYQAEVTWNESAGRGAGGGGQSELYAKPSYQLGIGPQASDGARDLPDLALTASADDPGVAVENLAQAGVFASVGGTSVASPLAAGIFALLSGQLGCAQGDVHGTLYALGQASSAGFHDLTSGNNDYDGIAGFPAGPGYDLATGWGTLDVANLIAAWPACGSSAGTSGSSSSGSTTASSTSSGQGTGGGSSGGTQGSTSSGNTSSGRLSTSSGGPVTGTAGAMGNTTGTMEPAASGCGCSSDERRIQPELWVLALAGLGRRRRRS